MAVLRQVANGSEATKNYLTADEQNSEFGRRSLKMIILNRCFPVKRWVRAVPFLCRGEAISDITVHVDKAANAIVVDLLRVC